MALYNGFQAFMYSMLRVQSWNHVFTEVPVWFFGGPTECLDPKPPFERKTHLSHKSGVIGFLVELFIQPARMALQIGQVGRVFWSGSLNDQLVKVL